MRAFILLAGLMDIFDGKMLVFGISSKFGVDFDSLADVVSFCVAPSLLVYNLYCENINYIVGAIFSFIPLIAGTVRLAKYNLDTDEILKAISWIIYTNIYRNYSILYVTVSMLVAQVIVDSRIGIILVCILGLLMLSLSIFQSSSHYF